MELSLQDFQSQAQVYERLRDAIDRQSFVHAYLITGPDGVGKRSLARLIAQGVLCGENGVHPCGTCEACQKIAHGNHADVFTIGSNPKEIIKIDTIREEVLDVVSSHSVEGSHRVIIIENAHKLNTGSQNALLKTLEEPAPGNIFILVTSVSRLLLPTIRSRCQELRLHPWQDAELEQIIRRHGIDVSQLPHLLPVWEGSIGKAIALSQDNAYWQLRQELMDDFLSIRQRSAIVTVSTKWGGKASAKTEAAEDSPSGHTQMKEHLLDVLEEMIRQLMLVNTGQRPAETLAHYPLPWKKMAQGPSIAPFIQVIHAIREAKKMKESNVTWQAVIERLLFQLLEVTIPWQT